MTGKNDTVIDFWSLDVEGEFTFDFLADFVSISFPAPFLLIAINRT